MGARVLIIRGLGRTTVPRPRAPKGRGPNERELNAIRDDSRADKRAAKGLGRRRVKAACQVAKKRVRKAGAAAVEEVRAESAAAVDAAETECASSREQKRENQKLGRALGAPAVERRAVAALDSAAVHEACAVKVPAVRQVAREALREIKALRRGNNAAAAANCERAREEVPRLLAGYLAQREARERLELDERREILYPPRAPRTTAQQRADRERGQRMKGKTRKRAGGARTVLEEADMEAANIAPEWLWLWRRHAFEFVRRARKRNEGHAHDLIQPWELFAQWLHGHGVADMWEEGPEQSEFAQEYEALVLAELERERLEHELDEAEAAGYSREEAREMMKRAVAGAASVRKTKPSPVTLDELADVFG